MVFLGDNRAGCVRVLWVTTALALFGLIAWQSAAEAGCELSGGQRLGQSLGHAVPSADQFSPFRVLFVCTKSRVRTENILNTARRTVREPRRIIFYAVFFNDYLASNDPLHDPLFHDQQGNAVGLLPPPISLPTMNRRGIGECGLRTVVHTARERGLSAAGKSRRLPAGCAVRAAAGASRPIEGR